MRINTSSGGTHLQVGDLSPICLNNSWPVIAFCQTFGAAWHGITGGSQTCRLVLNILTGSVELAVEQKGLTGTKQ